MINENRAQSAPTHNGKVSDIFANTQMRTPKYRIGDIVRAKDGAELPIENIVNNGQEILYVVGGLYESEKDIEPITPPERHQSDTEATAHQQHHAGNETPAEAICEADAAVTESGTPPTDAHGFDFSKVDNPGTPPDDVRELPIWGLPADLQRVVVDVANGYQCSRDFVVASMFVAAATMLGKRVSYKFDNYTNFPGLWVAIVGNSASGKTAPLSFFFNPIEMMERKAFEAYHNEMRHWEKTEISDRGAKPEYRHNLINNPTDESVLHELAVNGSVCWKVDELRTMFDSWGKYSKSGGSVIVGNLLSIFNNGDVNITRATSEPKYLAEPNLNIIGGIQPPILKRVMGNSGFVEVGLFQRFLFVFPDATEMPQFADARIDENICSTWRNTINILATYDGSIHETDDARPLHIGAINRWRDVCNRQYKDADAMISLLRKLEIHLCRWAIVAAVLSGSHTITADVMRYSIECMDYFRLCGEKAFCLIANENKPKELSNAEVMQLFNSRYPIINQSKFAEAIGKSQAFVSKTINNK